MLTVLGIDPGSVATGYGVIQTDGIRSFHIAHGHIALGNGDFNHRLGRIHTEISALLEQWHPDEVAIEQVFVSKNALSALKLGQARGAAIASVIVAGLPVAEYAPRTIKQAVVGSGSANKQQVQMMMGDLLGLKLPIQNDAADGLAIALCHAHSRGIKSVLAGRSSRGGSRRRTRWPDPMASVAGMTGSTGKTGKTPVRTVPKAASRIAARKKIVE